MLKVKKKQGKKFKTPSQEFLEEKNTRCETDITVESD